jgi:hypothetical protein
MKIRLVGVELFHAVNRTDGHDEATVAFPSFANKPEIRLKIIVGLYFLDLVWK